MLQVDGCINATFLPSLSVMVTAVCRLLPSWRPGCPGGRVSSIVNCSAPSRATLSSTTAMLVQAVSFPVGKLNVLEICSKSAPPSTRERDSNYLTDSAELSTATNLQH